MPVTDKPIQLYETSLTTLLWKSDHTWYRRSRNNLHALEFYSTNDIEMDGYYSAGNVASTPYNYWRHRDCGSNNCYSTCPDSVCYANNQTTGYLMKASKDDVFRPAEPWPKVDLELQGLDIPVQKVNGFFFKWYEIKFAKFWEPICPGGYVHLGYGVSVGDEPKIQCVNIKYTKLGKLTDWHKVFLTLD